MIPAGFDDRRRPSPASVSPVSTPAGALSDGAGPAAALLAVAMLFGGGGTPAPISELVVQCAAAVALAAWAWTGPVERVARPAWAIAALLLLGPLIQLVPLPPAWWQALPGRETMAQALALVGVDNTWRPLSVSPSRTLASLLAMGPPAVLFAMTASLSLPARRRMIVVVAAVALLSVAVGMAQLGGVEGLRFYGGAHGGFLLGFQANRNAQADMLLIGMAAWTAWWFARGFPPGRAAVNAWGGLAAMGLGLLFTGSRTGIALGAGAAACFALLCATRWRRQVGRVAWGGLLAIGMGGVAAVWSLRDNPAVARVVGRFSFSGDARSDLWADTLYALGQTWPWGSGFGTFVPALLAAERLEVVDPSYPNRAHNDYLELAVEAGLFGIVSLVLIVALLMAAARTTWRQARNADDRAPIIFAGFTLAVLAIHSLVDYPLRSMALASVGAVAAGLLMPCTRHPFRRRTETTS